VLRKPDNTFATRQEDQAEVLKNAFFPDHPPQVLVRQPDDPEPIDPRAERPISVVEIKEMLSDTSNVTAPGDSGLGYQLIKWAVEGDYTARQNNPDFQVKRCEIQIQVKITSFFR
jgi:hypothetical protein